MRKCKTYMIMLPYSKSAIDDTAMKSIYSVLDKYLENDVFISIYPTPFNHITKYITSITILRNSLEEALSISMQIEEDLEKIGERPERHETVILYGNDVPKFWLVV